METAVPAETLLQDQAAPIVKPGFTKRSLRDPALGILLAVIISALIWPVLVVLWIYVLR